MEDLNFTIEIDGKLKEAEIVYSYYDEEKDKFYIIFEIEDADNLEAAIVISNQGEEIVLEDIETDEEFNNLLKQYEDYLEQTDNLRDDE